jgi:hypothetical protein
MKTRMDRGRFQVSTHEDLEKQDKEYRANATIAERLETITYLRECFHVAEASTGRLQRLNKVLELK